VTRIRQLDGLRALAVMAVMFSISSFVIGPLITGDEDNAPPQPGIEQPPGHEEHH